MTTTLLILSIELIVILLAAVAWLGYSAHKQKSQRRNALQKLLGTITKSESDRLTALDNLYQSLGAEETKSNMAARKLILAEKKFFQALVAATLDTSGDPLAKFHQPTQALIDQCLEQVKSAQPDIQQPTEASATETPATDTEADSASVPAASTESDEIEVTMDADEQNSASDASPSPLDDIEVTMDEDDETSEQTEAADEQDNVRTDSFLNDDIEVTMEEDEEPTPSLSAHDTPEQATSLSNDDIEVTMEEDEDTEPPAQTLSDADEIEVTMDDETTDPETAEDAASKPPDETLEAATSAEASEEIPEADQEEPSTPQSLLKDDIEVILDDEEMAEEAHEEKPAEPEPSTDEASTSDAEEIPPPAHQDDIEKAVDPIKTKASEAKEKTAVAAAKDREQDDPLDLSWLDEMENEATSFEPDLDLDTTQKDQKKPSDQSD